MSKINKIYYKTSFYLDKLWERGTHVPIYGPNEDTIEFNDVSVGTLAAFKEALKNGEIKTIDALKTSLVNSNPVMLSTVDRFGLPFATYLCQNTGLIVTSPMLSESTLSEYYEKYYHKLNYGKENISDLKTLYKQGQGNKIWQYIKSWIMDRKKPIHVVEIGMGLGDVLAELRDSAQKDGCTVECEGTEFSTTCLMAAKEKNVKGIQGDLNDLAVRGKKYDLVILSHVFEHFTNLKSSLEKIRKLLVPNGLLYIEVPGVMSIHRNVDYNYNYNIYATHAHCYNFNLTSLSNVLGNGGFSILCGDEECKALFTIKDDTDSITPPDHLSQNASIIFGYLYRLYLERDEYKSAATKYKQTIRDNQRYLLELNEARKKLYYLKHLEGIYLKLLTLRRFFGRITPKNLKKK